MRRSIPTRRTRSSTARAVAEDVGLTRLATYVSSVKGTPRVRRTTLQSCAAIVAAAVSIEAANPELRMSVHMSGVDDGGNISWANIFGSGPLVDPAVLRLQSQVHHYCRGADGLSRAAARLGDGRLAHHVGTYALGEPPVPPSPGAPSGPRSPSDVTDEEYVDVMTSVADVILPPPREVAELRRQLYAATVGADCPVEPDIALEGDMSPEALSKLTGGTESGPRGIQPLVLETVDPPDVHFPSDGALTYLDAMLTADKTTARTIRTGLRAAVLCLAGRVNTTPGKVHDCLTSWWPSVLVPPGSAHAPVRGLWAYCVNVPKRMMCTSKRKRDPQATGSVMHSIERMPTTESAGSQNDVVASLLLLWDKEPVVRTTLNNALFYAVSSADRHAQEKAVRDLNKAARCGQASGTPTMRSGSDQSNAPTAARSTARRLAPALAAAAAVRVIAPAQGPAPAQEPTPAQGPADAPAPAPVAATSSGRPAAAVAPGAAQAPAAALAASVSPAPDFASAPPPQPVSAASAAPAVAVRTAGVIEPATVPAAGFASAAAVASPAIPTAGMSALPLGARASPRSLAHAPAPAVTSVAAPAPVVASVAAPAPAMASVAAPAPVAASVAAPAPAVASIRTAGRLLPSAPVETTAHAGSPTSTVVTSSLAHVVDVGARLAVDLVDRCGAVMATASVDNNRKVFHGATVPNSCCIVRVVRVFSGSSVYPHEAQFPVEPPGCPGQTLMRDTLGMYIVWEKAYVV